MGTKNKRALTRVLDETTFAGDPSVVTYDIDPAGANQVTLLLAHSEGTSATKLELDVSLFIDADSEGGRVAESVFGSDAEFNLGEESVGSASSGSTEVTITERQYVFDATFLDGNLPVCTFPISHGPFKLRLTFTETASAAGSIKGVALLDNT